jgi:carbonic anhydrase/acetyltransferase-like protein (isoleucine patch superfamily)
MQTLSYNGKKPKINKTNFLAPGAIVIGDLVLGNNVNIWFNCVVRADVNQIIIGKNTNVQDLSMLHVTEGHKLTIGKNVSIGHNVILHGCTIGDGCLIGMGANILDGAIIGKHCLVAAGSVVPPGKEYPEGSMIMGAPAKAVRALRLEEIESIANHYKSYVNYAETYMSDKVKLIN